MANIALLSLERSLRETKNDLEYARNAYDRLNDKGSNYAGEALRIVMFYQDLKILIERHLRIANVEAEDAKQRVRAM